MDRIERLLIARRNVQCLREPSAEDRQIVLEAAPGDIATAQKHEAQCLQYMRDFVVENFADPER